MLRVSLVLTIVAAGLISLFAFGSKYAFARMRSIYFETARLYGEITGRLVESVGGVRVIKAYRVE
jgi:ABC-type bacteriocin/lantibiotic exporter with double-glycine peptidase domain